MELLISTRNPHKLDEIRAILRMPGVDLVGLDRFPDAPDVVEDAATFEGNAVKKAVQLARRMRRWTLADDSGLEVDALGGQPGVFSARYAGEPVSYRANNDKLLRELAGAACRTARFRCVLALAAPDGALRTVEGRCEGTIVHACRGAEGFGYDPLFVPAGCSQTFAEMPAELKNRISHRAAALASAVREWGRMLAREGGAPPGGRAAGGGGCHAG